MRNIEKSKKLWKELSDICINENEEIEKPFLDFEKGTDRYAIWHWFEEEFDLSVAKDLMGSEWN